MRAAPPPIGGEAVGQAVVDEPLGCLLERMTANERLQGLAGFVTEPRGVAFRKARKQLTVERVVAETKVGRLGVGHEGLYGLRCDGAPVHLLCSDKGVG